MAIPDIVKLAPGLSIEERYKIVIPDGLRMMAGEKSLLSESEIKALTSFEKDAVWEQYALRVGMFKWAHILWLRDIEKEKFCACTCILLLNEALWRMIADEDESQGKEALADNLATVRKYVALLEDKLADFYPYREALVRLREELYDVPIFNKETEATIQGFFQFVSEMVERHNETIRELCTNKVTKQHFILIKREMEIYTVKEPKLEEVSIVKLIDELKSFAESDVKARSNK